MIEIPLQNGNPNFEFKTELSGVTYTFHFRYNTRSACWVMDLSTAVGDPILTGIAVRLGIDLLSQFEDDRLPPGRLFAINYNDEYAEAGINNFGTDVAIVYQETES